MNPIDTPYYIPKKERIAHLHDSLMLRAKKIKVLIGTKKDWKKEKVR